ncbi:hypothetical protein ACHAWO_004660 [Cyclotella atomus]|uniref:Uncharacterized protein n=1 Tax=Cyclotella atomus TaxID=382360 RepID=A0ABD3N182_9STRA
MTARRNIYKNCVKNVIRDTAYIVAVVRCAVICAVRPLVGVVLKLTHAKNAIKPLAQDAYRCPTASVVIVGGALTAVLACIVIIQIVIFVGATVMIAQMKTTNVSSGAVCATFRIVVNTCSSVVTTKARMICAPVVRLGHY